MCGHLSIRNKLNIYHAHKPKQQNKIYPSTEWWQRKVIECLFPSSPIAESCSSLEQDQLSFFIKLSFTRTLLVKLSLAHSFVRSLMVNTLYAAPLLLHSLPTQPDASVHACSFRKCFFVAVAAAACSLYLSYRIHLPISAMPFPL